MKLKLFVAFQMLEFYDAIDISLCYNEKRKTFLLQGRVKNLTLLARNIFRFYDETELVTGKFCAFKRGEKIPEKKLSLLAGNCP